MENLIIIGSGPAACTAAIYSARARMEPLVFEGMMAGGIAAGGQLTTTTHVENYPGFPDPISGNELMQRMRQQALNCGARIETKTVTKVELSQKPYRVFVNEQAYETRVIIIATGAFARRLGLPGEEKFWQRGISACAVCDGALPVFRDKPVAVIGGGDSAVEEAEYLSKYAAPIYVIHRRNQLRASKIMQERLFANKKIKVIWDTVVIRAKGDDFLNAIDLQNVKTKEEREMAVKGLFYAVGHVPNTAFLQGQVPLDEKGYILTGPGTTRTRIEGVFASGDVQDMDYRQAVTAAGSGCMAAIDAERYLAQNNGKDKGSRLKEKERK